MSYSFEHLAMQAEIILRGHILNWMWRPRMRRRRVRGAVTAEVVGRYIDRYVSLSASFPEDAAALSSAVPSANPPAASLPDGERIYSIWLQGEDKAPSIVRACWRSVRANCSLPLVILDEQQLLSGLGLPEYVIAKYRAGKMTRAHFSDICRVELLYRYGGIWLDATDFVTEDFPQWLLDEDFFIYRSGDCVSGAYAFVQNCFFRSRRGNYILGAWRDAILAYWKAESGAVDYFVHQLLFWRVVCRNEKAAELFAAMPEISQDATHMLWFGYRDKPFDRKVFDELTSTALFQKTEYKSSSAKNPLRGSFAEQMMNMYL